MEILPFSFVRGLLFIVGTLLLLFISRKAVRNPRCHGFYRFFAFLGILFLVLYNYPFWFIDVFAPWQIVSWLLLSVSVLFVLQGIWILRKAGGSQARAEMPENFTFENTVTLVTGGIYGYIRHPMYSSLLLLAWGAFFKHFTIFGLGLVLLTSLFLYITGLMEEKENLAFFGPTYREYMKSTKMFLPFIL